jgi:hypothetical protein
MTLRPKTPKDLLLAPVAAQIDLNLQEIRDLPPGKIADTLGLVLNADRADVGRGQRAARILEFGVRSVELHEWDTEITDDAARLRLSGGSVSLDLGLSASITDYVENGPDH